MTKPDVSIHRLRLLVALSVAGAIIILAGGAQPAAATKPGVELSFEGGPDGSDDDGTGENYYPVRNFSTEGTTSNPFPGGQPQLVIELNGTAHRTNYGEGKFGRGIELSGASADGISVTQLYDGFDAPDLWAFWSLRSAASGIFWEEKCRFQVGIESGELYVTVFDQSCSTSPGSKTFSGLTWPVGSGWHHLLIRRGHNQNMQHYFQLVIDFDLLSSVDVVVVDLPGIIPTDIYFGKGIDGFVDELHAAVRPPDLSTLFDYDPDNCGFDPAITCEEYVAQAMAIDLENVDWHLPVRYKIMYDENECTTEIPCRVVFALSGGGVCPDDYPSANDGALNKILEADSTQPSGSKLAVVVVDTICWAPGFPSYPDEATQMVAVKDDIALNHSFLFDVTEYYATGCSHGADLVLKWAVEEEVADRPKRIFSRSVTDHGEAKHCNYHSEWCGVKQRAYDIARFSNLGSEGCENIQFFPHDEAEQCVIDFFTDPEQDPYIHLVTLDLVGNGPEVGRSWGRNDPPPEEPTCSDDEVSIVLCDEEGGIAATDGGRQFRDKWREIEDQLELETGYFIENDEQDCRHCILTEPQLNCFAIYLEGGRDEVNEDANCVLLDANPGELAADCSAYDDE